jgi:hypothetical protein
VAQCSGPGFRRLGPLAAALACAAAFAQTPTSAPSASTPTSLQTEQASGADARQVQGRHDRQMAKSIKIQDPAAAHPDTALLEYLGDYGDAADGLDPMGLDDPDAPAAKADGGKR